MEILDVPAVVAEKTFVVEGGNVKTKKVDNSSSIVLFQDYQRCISSLQLKLVSLNESTIYVENVVFPFKGLFVKDTLFIQRTNENQLMAIWDKCQFCCTFTLTNNHTS